MVGVDDFTDDLPGVDILPHADTPVRESATHWRGDINLFFKVLQIQPGFAQLGLKFDLRVLSRRHLIFCSQLRHQTLVEPFHRLPGKIKLGFQGFDLGFKPGVLPFNLRPA
jgi:hypothetical protein